MTVAVLFADPRGAYSLVPDVDLWCEQRDARLYAGPHPIVAHPPCARWCQLAGLVEARWGLKKGDDGGCFKSALESVRKWGGVLEHPAYSLAWAAHGLAAPPRSGLWQRTLCGGHVAHVEQWRYGHPARKATWLYVHGTDELPDLRWGSTPWTELALVSWCGNKVGRLDFGGKGSVVGRAKHRADDTRKRLTRKQASATPHEFRDVLLSIARSCR